MKLSPLKRVVFVAAAVTGSLVLVLIVLLGADLYAHHRVERSAGLNRHGYRGAVVGRKPPGEIRVVMLGGSTVFGFNVAVEEALPAQLERALIKAVPAVRVVNLGFNGEGAATFVPTLRSYDFLDYDAVVLYEGYNDILGDASPNLGQKRQSSAVFRLTGYYPILPQILREKATMLRQGGAAGGDGKVVFRPGMASRTTATALDAASAFTDRLGTEIGRLVENVDPAAHVGPGCGAPWSSYCGAVEAAVHYLLDRGTPVLVVGQPRLAGAQAERHAWQQRELAVMIARDFSGNPNVHYIDVADAADLGDGSIATDGLHLSPEANAIVAARLAGPVQEMVTLRRGK